MQPEDVTRVLSDPLAQELMQSSIPARLAYVGPDGFPRAIPIGFHWNGTQFVLCTVPHAPKVPALKANPKVARGAGARDVQADGSYQDHAALGQVVRLSDALSNSDRAVDPPGELTSWTRQRVGVTTGAP